MTPAPAKTVDTNALEDLGRATLQIVHDLKNQLNGLKLYATFLRKRADRDDRSPEERETLIKLIAGLDRSARDMTALVRYSQPVELHRQPHTDLRNLISAAVKKVTERPASGASLIFQVESPLLGEFDALTLTEALRSLTEEAVDSLSSRDLTEVSLHARREGGEALIEWRGVKTGGRNHSLRASTNYGTIYSAQAARIIEAHDGRFECDATSIRAWLPLSE
jgi:signal transduction histidine kinase